MVKFGPWAPDQPYAEGALQTCENAIPMTEWYAPLPTLDNLTTSAVSGTVKGAYSARLVGVTAKTYVGTASQLYERSGSGWTTVSGVTYTLTTADARWEFTQWEDDIYAVSIDAPLQRQVAGTGSFTTTAGWPQAGCIGNVREWVICGDLSESSVRIPHKLRWCDIGDPSSWSAPGTNAAEVAQAGEQLLDAADGKITGIAGGEFGIVFQQHAITRMVYVGAPIVWQFDKIDDRNGCEVAGSIVQVGRNVYYLSHDGFRVTDGSGASQPIGDGVITQWVRDNLSTAYKQLITGAYDPFNRIIMWSIPVLGTINNRLLVYSLQSQRWALGTFGCEALFDGATTSVTLEQLDAYSASLDALPASLDSEVWLGGELTFYAMSSGYLSTFTGTPGTCTMVTNEYQPNPGGRAFVSSVEPITRGTTTVGVGTKNLPTDSMTYTAQAATNSRTGQANFRSTGRYIALKFEMTGDFVRADGYNLEAKSEGVS